MQSNQLLQRGIDHHRAGRLEEAKAVYTRIRSLLPQSFDATHLLGLVAYQQGRAAEAVDLLTVARRLNASSAVCASRLGLALIADGRPRDAETALRDAVRLKPDMVEAWENLALCLKLQDRLTEATECGERAASLDPRKASVWHNLGLTWAARGRPVEALRCQERAAQADPAYAKAHFGRAQALQQLNDVPGAVAAYDQFLRAEPDHFEALSYRLYALNFLSGIDRVALFEAHREFGRRLGAPPVVRPSHPDPARRLRVGVLSPDLREHSCAYFIEPLLRHLDREHFEVFLYHDHFRADEVSERLKGLAAGWRSIVARPAREVEALIRQDAPDILIDLAGHTGLANRITIFARRLAPVQVSYLGYPNTTGVPGMDYRLTDDVADPVGDSDPFATERLVRFSESAWAYQPPGCAPAPHPSPCTSAAAAPVSFGCFNNLSKVTDEMLAVWAALLRRVPDSRLVLKGRGLDDAGVRGRFETRLASAGLTPERVLLLPRAANTREHLEQYGRIDIALDTFPYHGTTTTCEALWMGVPVVTQLGDRHAARVGASLLRSVGHSEWVAHSPDDYVRIAAGLAEDRPGLAALRQSLRDEMGRSILLNHAEQAARFGAALRTCWRECCGAAAAR